MLEKGSGKSDVRPVECGRTPSVFGKTNENGNRGNGVRRAVCTACHNARAVEFVRLRFLYRHVFEYAVRTVGVRVLRRATRVRACRVPLFAAWRGDTLRAERRRFRADFALSNDGACGRAGGVLRVGGNADCLFHPAFRPVGQN